MGFEIPDLKQFSAFRKEHPAGSSVAILGDCHFHFSTRDLTSLTGQNFSGPDETVTLEHFAKAFNFSRIETLDICGNPTMRLDLTQPVPSELVNQFDWVIDAGTMCCCFDIAAVLRNIMLMLRPDGFVLHWSYLVGYFGRGYYSIQPALFMDHYPNNGFELLYMGTRVKPAYMINSQVAVPISQRVRAARSRTPLRQWLQGQYQWNELGIGHTFLGKASRFDIQFAPEHLGSEPDQVPNNVLVMCFARRRNVQALVPSVPTRFRDAKKE